MVDKDTGNYKEGTIREAIADFRKTIAVEYSELNKFQLLEIIKNNNPNLKSGDFVAIATIRQEVAVSTLEDILWDERKDS